MSGAQQAGTLILFVDDDEDVRVLFIRAALAQGVRVLPARDGIEALELAQDHAPDVIVLDIGLPRMDGRDVLVRLREDPRTSNIPVVVVSGFCDQTRRHHVLQLGAMDCIEKPLDVSALLRKVLFLVKKAREERPQQEAAAMRTRSSVPGTKKPQQKPRTSHGHHRH